MCPLLLLNFELIDYVLSFMTPNTAKSAVVALLSTCSHFLQMIRMNPPVCFEKVPLRLDLEVQKLSISNANTAHQQQVLNQQPRRSSERSAKAVVSQFFSSILSSLAGSNNSSQSINSNTIVDVFDANIVKYCVRAIIVDECPSEHLDVLAVTLSQQYPNLESISISSFIKPLVLGRDFARLMATMRVLRLRGQIASSTLRALTSALSDKSIAVRLEILDLNDTTISLNQNELDLLFEALLARRMLKKFCCVRATFAADFHSALAKIIKSPNCSLRDLQIDIHTPQGNVAALGELIDSFSFNLSLQSLVLRQAHAVCLPGIAREFSKRRDSLERLHLGLYCFEKTEESISQIKALIRGNPRLVEVSLISHLGEDCINVLQECTTLPRLARLDLISRLASDSIFVLSHCKSLKYMSCRAKDWMLPDVEAFATALSAAKQLETLVIRDFYFMSNAFKPLGEALMRHAKLHRLALMECYFHPHHLRDLIGYLSSMPHLRELNLREHIGRCTMEQQHIKSLLGNSKLAFLDLRSWSCKHASLEELAVQLKSPSCSLVSLTLPHSIRNLFVGSLQNAFREAILQSPSLEELPEFYSISRSSDWDEVSTEEQLIYSMQTLYRRTRKQFVSIEQAIKAKGIACPDKGSLFYGEE